MRNYKKATEAARKRHRALVLLRGTVAKEKIVEHAGGKCSKCGYSKSTRALEFHHLKQYDFRLNTFEMRSKTWNEIVAEATKCVLLCSNCHHEEEERIAREKFCPGFDKNAKWSDILREMCKKSRKVLPFLDFTCEICKTEFKAKKHRRFCSSKCSSVFKRKVVRPSKNELENDESSGITIDQMSKKYGVSTTTIKTWRRKNNIWS